MARQPIMNNARAAPAAPRQAVKAPPPKVRTKKPAPTQSKAQYASEHRKPAPMQSKAQGERKPRHPTGSPREATPRKSYQETGDRRDPIVEPARARPQRDPTSGRGYQPQAGPKPDPYGSAPKPMAPRRQRDIGAGDGRPVDPARHAAAIAAANDPNRPTAPKPMAPRQPMRPGGMMGGADGPMMDPAMRQAQMQQAQMQRKLQMAQAQQPMGAPQQFPGAGPMAGAPMQVRPPQPAMPMGATPMMPTGAMARPPMAPQMNPAYAGGAMGMRQAAPNPMMTKAPVMQGQAPAMAAPQPYAKPQPTAQPAPQPMPKPVGGFS